MEGPGDPRDKKEVRRWMKAGQSMNTVDSHKMRKSCPEEEKTEEKEEKEETQQGCKHCGTENFVDAQSRECWLCTGVEGMDENEAEEQREKTRERRVRTCLAAWEVHQKSREERESPPRLTVAECIQVWIDFQKKMARRRPNFTTPQTTEEKGEQLQQQTEKQKEKERADEKYREWRRRCAAKEQEQQDKWDKEYEEWVKGEPARHMAYERQRLKEEARWKPSPKTLDSLAQQRKEEGEKRREKEKQKEERAEAGRPQFGQRVEQGEGQHVGIGGQHLGFLTQRVSASSTG